MDLAEDGGGQQWLRHALESVSVSVAFTGDEEIAEARDVARTFLTDLQVKHDMLVSPRSKGVVELVVSELVTNSRKYAPGPGLLTLEVNDGAVEVTVWDSEPQPPTVQAADPSRIGQHGLEIVLALCRSFEVHREPVGKRVVAAIVLADDAVGDMVDPRAAPPE
ncbi:ATP-binding protein [Streptomyces sp. NPDC005574]|uniref:ATP-binding protein n=1 Tax=Streptomyces sp. NPDC005574 TaxID=3156891 RepID=UPI0033AA6369